MHFKRISKILITWVLLLFIAPTSQAQQQKYFDDPDMIHREAISMFEARQYGAARQSFRQLMDMLDDKNDILYVDAAYYDAVCAIELELADAGATVNNFAHNYRTSRWKPRVDFLQARVFFADRKYADALDIFHELDPYEFSASERNEYFFKSGFSRMKQNDLSAASADFSRAKMDNGPFRDASIYYYAHIQYLNRNYNDALQHFKQIESNHTFNKLIPAYMMQIHYQQGDFAQIVSMGDRVYNQAENRRKPEIARMMADAYYKLEQFDKALEYYINFERLSRRQMSREDNYQLGITRFKTGLYSDAINNFQKAIGQDDTLSQNAYYYLAASYQQTGQQNFARNAFLSAYKAGFDTEITEDALFNYARLSIESGPDPFNEAIDALQDFINNNPNSERRNEAFGYVVQLYLSSRNYDAALDFIEKETPNDPALQATYVQLAYARGIELYHARNYREAVSYLARAANQRHDPQTAARATFWMADAYYNIRNFEAARNHYRSFMSTPAARQLDIYSLAAYNLGYTYFSQKQYNAALPSFRQFIANPYRDKPDLVIDAWLRIADCQFIGKSYGQAIESYDKVINAMHTESDYALFQKAHSFGALGRFNDKLSTLDQLVRNHPASAYYDNALYEMASTNLVMNDNRSAISYFDRLVREKPRSPFAKEALVKTGLIYFNNDQNDRAITTLKKVIEDYPTTTEAREALNTLRVIYMDMNNLQEYFSYTEKLGFVQVSVNEQDSLAFTMAENFYQEGRCGEAIKALENYITTYPQGAYLLQANYFKARCELRENRPDIALQHFRFIINYTDNQYTDEALLEAARILYDQEDYEESNKYYKSLYTLSDDPIRQLESLEGRMKSSFFLQHYEDAIEGARQLLQRSRVGQEQILQAHYIMGKSLFEMGRLDEASKELKVVHHTSSGVLGAEAYYLMASISYQNGYYDDAENQLFELADQYSAYDYWVARGFILLADIYVRQDNNFQARQTLQSIIDNYKGQDLRELAARKLAAISE